jgi:L-lysine 6-transaminase
MEQQVFPGSKSEQLLKELQDYVIVEPYPFVVDLKQSRAMELATIDGHRLTDWTGLYGSKLLGYNHPTMFEPEYLETLAYASATKLPNPDFLTPECLAYYRLLYKLAPKCMQNPQLEVYAVNSGAEAVENMMKYFINVHRKRALKRQESPGPARFLYFDQAFHGRTVFALNITKLEHDPVITKDFQGMVPGNLKVPFPAWNNSMTDRDNRKVLHSALATLEYVMDQYGPEIAGVILEPIQGAGGHRIAHRDFYSTLSKLCYDHQVLWGLDEVQTAGGQCGEVFAIDCFPIPHAPNAVASAKKLANGVIYMLDHMEDVGVLDSTWGGTLSDMVRFTQEWKIVEQENLLAQVPQKTQVLVKGLQSLEAKYPGTITNIRGLGLYQGFSFINPKLSGKAVDLALEQEHLLLLGAGPGTIRLRPPLDVTLKDIQIFLEKLERVLISLTQVAG